MQFYDLETLHILIFGKRKVAENNQFSFTYFLTTYDIAMYISQYKLYCENKNFPIT